MSFYLYIIEQIPESRYLSPFLPRVTRICLKKTKNNAFLATYFAPAIFYRIHAPELNAPEHYFPSPREDLQRSKKSDPPCNLAICIEYKKCYNLSYYIDDLVNVPAEK